MTIFFERFCMVWTKITSFWTNIIFLPFNILLPPSSLAGVICQLGQVLPLHCSPASRSLLHRSLYCSLYLSKLQNIFVQIVKCIYMYCHYIALLSPGHHCLALHRLLYCTLYFSVTHRLLYSSTVAQIKPFLKLVQSSPLTFIAILCFRCLFSMLLCLFVAIVS